MERDSHFRQVDTGSSQRDPVFVRGVSRFNKQGAGFNEQDARLNEKDTESRMETGAVNLVKSHRN
jgi:hypothetical protein